LIFDWDGTLIDSEYGIVSCMKSAIHDVGLPILSDLEIGNIIGLGLYEAISTLYPTASEGQYEKLIERYRHYFFTMEQSLPFDGVSATLKTLHERGFDMAIATGKGRAGLERAMQNMQFKHVFKTSRCADETQSKPHPQMLYEILEELQVGAESALMVGDTEYDLAMAQTAEIDCVAVSYGVHDIKRLHQYSPVTTLNNFSELLPWLNRGETLVKPNLA